MTTNNSNQDSSSDLPPSSQDDPDLGFASESHMPFGPTDRKAFEKEEPETEADPNSTWSPEDAAAHAKQPSESEPPESKPTESVAEDTWVPGQDDSGQLDANKTWVPSSTPTADGLTPPPGASNESDDASEEAEFDPDSTWVTPPAGAAESPSSDDGQTEEFDPDSTWVTPPSGAAPSDAESMPAAEASDDPFEKTWVPPEAASKSSSDDEDEEPTTPAGYEPKDLDPNSTWVPSKTPTVDGSENVPPLDPEQTWTPSSTPTADGIQNRPRQPDSSDDEVDMDSTVMLPQPGGRENQPPDSHDDFEKTWVPSDTPTADGVSSTPDGHEPPDPDSTWVMPPGGQSQPSDSGDDFEKTWVPADDITTTGMDRPDKQADFEQTIAMPADKSGDGNKDTDFDSTVDLGTKDKSQPKQDDGDVFQKTIGMRRPLDLSDLPAAALSDDAAAKTIHLDLPEQKPDSKDMSSTQLWARQSGANLNHSLTIRSRPVAGDEIFEIPDQEPDKPDYEIVEKIGEGGMGAIFLANQTSLDRQLAIKTLKASPGARRSKSGTGKTSSADQQRRDMFLAEALITANLVHPHIIPIHDLCETADGLPFYSMKRVVGTPWCDKLRNMDLDENLEVLKKVCDAVAYAHHNGVVNRDLKPENVMLGEFGEVLVLDWGLAVPSTPADKKRFSSPSAPFGAGTPAYMAPELWTGPEEIIGYWSDIYLLGAILFEVITGKAPHKFSEPSQKAGNTGLWMVIDKVVRRNDIRQTEHTGELMDIAMKAMSTRPKDRFESVLKFQEALKNFQRHEESRRLTERAAKALESTQDDSEDTGYLGYQSAAALYEEAQSAWEENKEAEEGLRETRLQYANLAHQKGDYDLGLQIAELEDGEPFEEVKGKLTRSRRIRNALKTAVVTACGIIVVVGAFSFVQSLKISAQNKEIVALSGTKDELQADIEVKEQNIAKAEARIAKAQDEIQTAEADAQAAKQEAEAATNKATIASKAAEDATKKAEAALADAEKAGEDLKKSEQLLAAAEAKKEKADQDLAAANEILEETNQKVAELEVRKSRSAVELKNSEIASLIRNGDYSTALAEVDRLIEELDSSEEMAALPKEEQARRLSELRARKRQLQQRSVKVEAPVQSQVISNDGKLIVWGDQSGKLQVRNFDSSDGISDTSIAQIQLPGVATSLTFVSDNKAVLAAAGNQLHVWDIDSNKQTELTGHQGQITAVRSSGDFVLSADSQGAIKAWSLTSGEEQWSMRTSSRILDLELLPKSQMLIYAGSRGGQSADILAYQLADLSSKERPKRLGQLKLPRQQNDPPRALAVSPDESKLLVSNSRNGRVLVLPRRTNIAEDDRDQFPFVHATELEEQQPRATWIADEHQRPVNDICFSADGQRFCTASDDRTIRVWEIGAEEVKSIVLLEGHGARVNSVDFVDPAGVKLISSAADRYCRLWNVDEYEQQKKELEQEFKLSSHSGQSPILARSASEYRLTSVLQNYSLALRAGISPRFRITDFLPLLTTFPADEFSDTSSSDPEPEVIVLNTAPALHRGGIQSVEYSADGRFVTTGGQDGTAVLWNSKTGKPVSTLRTNGNNSGQVAFDEGHDFNVSRFRFLPPDGRYLLTTGFDGALCVWDADPQDAGTGHQRLKVSGLGLVNAVATSADGQFIAMSSLGDGSHPGDCRIYRTAELLHAAQPTPTVTLTGFHASEISAIDLSPTGDFAVTGGRDGKVALWSCGEGTLIAGARIHVKNTIVSSLKLLNDGQILSSGYDGRLLLMTPRAPDANTDQIVGFDVIRRFAHPRIPIERLALHPAKDRFVTLSIRTDKATNKVAYQLNEWSIDEEELQRSIQPAVVGGRAPSRIYSIDFSPDGSQLAAVVDQKLQIFDSESWRVTRVLGSNSAGMSDAIFRPQAASDESPSSIATFNGVAAQLWDLDEGKHLAGFRPLFSVESVSRSVHDEPLLATADRSIRFFQAEEGDDRFGQSVFKIEDPHSGTVTAVQFNPQRPDVLASAGTDRSVCFWKWNPETKEAKFTGRQTFEAPESSLLNTDDSVVDLKWTTDGEKLWLVGRSGDLYQIAETGERHFSGRVDSDTAVEIFDLDVSADGRFIAVSGLDQQAGVSMAWIYETTDGDELLLHCQLQGHEAGGTRAICFVPNSPYVATAGADGACLLWNWSPSRAAERPIEAYEAYQFLPRSGGVAHGAPINSIDVSPTGDIATASDDGTTRLWRNPFRQ